MPSNFSHQPTEPKGIEFLGFDGCHPGVDIRKFGEELSKTLPVHGAISPIKISWLWSQLKT